jgi:hypothetical protein
MRSRPCITRQTGPPSAQPLGFGQLVSVYAGSEVRADSASGDEEPHLGHGLSRSLGLCRKNAAVTGLTRGSGGINREDEEAASGCPIIVDLLDARLLLLQLGGIYEQVQLVCGQSAVGTPSWCLASRTSVSGCEEAPKALDRIARIRIEDTLWDPSRIPTRRRTVWWHHDTIAEHVDL